MSEHQCGASAQYGQGEGGGETGNRPPDQRPSINPGGTAGPPGHTAGQGGPGSPTVAGAGSSGQATEATMGGAPRPRYPYSDPHGAMGYSPYPPGMAGSYPPHDAAAHPAHYPGAGYYAPPPWMYPQYQPAGANQGGQTQAPVMHAGQGGGPAEYGAGHGMHAGMSQFVEEISNGGSGLSSLGKMLSLDDSEFWKGALIGAAAVLLLTNESVQNMLFKAGAKTKEAVESGVDKVKETASELAGQAKE